MTARLQLRLVDRDGDGRTTQMSVARPLSLAALIATVQEFEGVVSGISTARVALGSITLTRERTSGIAGLLSDVGRKGLLVTNEDSRYSSIAIPSLRLDLPYDNTGAYVDVRIRQTNPGAETSFAALLSFLADCTNADGSPFVVGPWVAARMLNR